LLAPNPVRRGAMIQETEKASNVDYQLFARPASQEFCEVDMP
jgi:hypothetical protein